MTGKKTFKPSDGAGGALFLGFGSVMPDVVMHVTDEVFFVLDGVAKGSRNLVDWEKFSSVFDAVKNYASSPVAKSVGGSAENTLFSLAAMGVRSRFLGKAGNDADARMIVEKFCSLGGEKTSFKYHDLASTGTCLSLVTPDAERTFFTYPGASAAMTAQEITEDDFAGVTHFHVEGYSLADAGTFEKVMSLAEKAGCFISFDASSCDVVSTYRREMLNAVERADLVFANEEEAETFAFGERRNDLEGAASVIGRHCRNVIIKLGGRGALVACDGMKTLLPAVPCTPVDTTGAGDAFQAGFLYGLANGLDAEVCGRLGNVLAHEVVMTEGSMPSADGWKRVREEFEKIFHNNLNWNV